MSPTKPPANLPTVSLTGRTIPEDVLRIIPREVATKYGVVAFERKGQAIKLAVADPARLRPDVAAALEEFAKRRGLTVELFAADPAEIDRLLALGSDKGAPDKGVPERITPARYIDLTRQIIPLEILEKLPREIAEKYQMIVFAGDDRSIQVAALRPNDPKVQEILHFIKTKNRLTIDLFQTDAASLKAALLQYEGVLPPKETPTPAPLPPAATEKVETPVSAPEIKPAPAGPIPQETVVRQALTLRPRSPDERHLNEFLGGPITTVEQLEAIIKKGQIQQIVAAIISLASALRASDIHLEPMDKQYRLRYRIDGILRTVILMPLTLHPPITSRVKILAEMKIDEQRIPQDGRYDVDVGGKEIDLRVSTLPTVHGEKVVIRLLDKSSGILTLPKLGLSGRAYEVLIKEIHRPYGVVLATGPTGSGKSTTLYAILHEIATPQVNVITLEDPVEYEIPGINQAQVKPAIGFSFAEGLRSILRQDPNVIMVGETRDAETAGMVTHAALTGHLVLSTLHTNDAAGALPRLINMGVEPFLITSAMNCVIAQRLVRRICPHCKTEEDVPSELKRRIETQIEKSPALKKAIGRKPIKFYKGKECSQCTQGYQGRIGVYEVLPMSEEIERLALKNSPASAIAAQARREGMLTMFEDGIVKAVAGITTLDEVFRVTSTG